MRYKVVTVFCTGSTDRYTNAVTTILDGALTVTPLRGATVTYAAGRWNRVQQEGKEKE